jgi:shikimate kinase
MLFKVILIGPISAGKSTLSKLIAEKLGIPCRRMDQVRIRYYYDLAKHIVYTEGKTPEETCAEIIEIITGGRQTAPINEEE